MYQSKVYVNDILNKMSHVLERFTFLSRSKSFKKEDVDQIDYHLNEIMRILNGYN